MGSDDYVVVLTRAVRHSIGAFARNYGNDVTVAAHNFRPLLAMKDNWLYNPFTINFGETTWANTVGKPSGKG